MNKRFDVVALGELLIDFTQNGMSNQGNPVYEANPGGAPCNVLSMLTKLGKKTAFIGKVGKDIFGNQLTKVISEVGIDASGLVMDNDVRTTLAFVEKKADGDRDFSFYRNPGADMMLKADEIDTSLIENAMIFHFGTLSMTNEPVRSATSYAIEIAKKNAVILSFDPNLREPLWDNLEDARVQTEFGLSVCDILKISDNEVEWFTGQKDLDKGVRIIQEKYQIPLILLSMGKEGSCAYYKDLCVMEPALIREDTIETTGAGDTFGACCINYVLENGLDDLTEDDLHEMLSFANVAASIITTRRGALKVMPTKEEIKALLK